MKLRLVDVAMPGPRVKTFRFQPAEGSGPLPAYSPGSALRIHLPVGEKGLWNNYSLTSNPWVDDAYGIAVRREDESCSKGGSIYLHDMAKPGDVFEVEPPVNRFALSRLASKHVLIAGGIGITPFLSYLPVIAGRGQPVELHYSYKGGDNAAFTDLLYRYVNRHCRVNVYDTAVNHRMNLSLILGLQSAGAHVYVCGPASLIEAVKQTARDLGWPASQVHYEHFSLADERPRRPFAVKLQSSGREVQVSESESLLEALEREGVPVTHSCRIGGCGSCEIAVSEGQVEHRDHCLSEEDRRAGCSMIACVSRAMNGQLVLKL